MAGSWNFATFVSKLEEGVIADGDVVCFAGGLYRTDDIVAVRIKNRRLTLRGGYPRIYVSARPLNLHILPILLR